MPLDPFSLIMLAVLALLIIFMFRNGRKRQQAIQQLQSGMQPGAEVMLQSGIFGTVLAVDAEDNRVTLKTGDSIIEVHRNAIGNIITPVDAPAEDTETQLAPDDDPAFGASADAAKNAEAAEIADSLDAVADDAAKPASDFTPADPMISFGETPAKPDTDSGDVAPGDEDPKKNS
ncbi:preprotein translocase subunit YajC [Leucobacter sp. M11]|uniref:preprotein translocase subunit YajC n=1 Tax=Leucobacter sp. M11 TaxID=2993565 RepID=UPI002D802B5B|nr:preprotein translocase subunit YajC [Leucobacter sp. M11]MEB4616212.1 preprotein translocase subunit YajC [Leucobacter sp. M11]